MFIVIPYTHVETQTPDEIPTGKVDMPADVGDESQDIPDYHEHDSLEDDPTWTPEEIDSAYKVMKDDDDDSQNAYDNPR